MAPEIKGNKKSTYLNPDDPGKTAKLSKYEIDTRKNENKISKEQQDKERAIPVRLSRI